MAEKQPRQNGYAIRYLRLKDGLKPGEFAAKAGISYPHLDNIERERKDASVEALYRIAGALNVAVEAIVRDSACLVQTPGAHNLGKLGPAA